MKSKFSVGVGVICFVLSLIWVVFQIYIVSHPLTPMVQRPLHVAFAVSLMFLFKPIREKGLLRFLDFVFVVLAIFIGVYFIYNGARIQSRIVFIDKVFLLDKIFCFLLVAMLIEGVRRCVGWSLLAVVVAFFLYGWFGYLFPSWLRFEGIKLDEYVELLFLGDSGIFGIPVGTSVRWVFYFVMFGAIYSIVGGSKLLVNLGLQITKRQKGGPAKAAVVASGLMGTVSGSAVANVATTGVLTIPFMKKAGYDKETAGAFEAIASTGGQLMPPIMGISAFVMAEFLGIPYLRVALAGFLPAILFYTSLFLLADLLARAKGIEGYTIDQEDKFNELWRRSFLFLPLFVIIFYIIRGYSPTTAALWGTVTAVVVSFLRKETRLNISKTVQVINSIGRQAANIVVPMAAIGIVIGVTIQSNLALKFSSKLLQISGGSLPLSLFFLVCGCIIMGMGIPTVAAYIICSVFFVPALIKFGISPLAAHFFVFYYGVLAMVTPPVALAAFTAAGIAGGDANKVGIRAFLFGLVAFLVPFAFLFKPALLWEGNLDVILKTALIQFVGAVTWAISLAGYVAKKISLPSRLLLGFLALLIIIPPEITINLLASLFSILIILWIVIFSRLVRERVEGKKHII
ncbi:MAG TPA: TRAP transporter fused permease subunit [Candidatus Aerophobetes bacterium]|uniref:TRAP transporter fused permease subunit n=1 Tax=Aerophobetes bacterium TaxID=2030807 RepID=A0A7V5HZK5_UNCAE|nr:TRAP transporter fused permease subunit [Candidatus Aerophobetes bacterium]